MVKPSLRSMNGSATALDFTPCLIETMTPSKALRSIKTFPASAHSASESSQNGRSRQRSTFRSIATIKRGWVMRPVSSRTVPGCSRLSPRIGCSMTPDVTERTDA